MSYYWYDPEVPAGYQDADIEMRELEAAAYDRNPDEPCNRFSAGGDGYCLRCGWSQKYHD